MSAEGADDLAIIGSGKQALTQVAAVAAVRRLRRMRVFSPTAAKRVAFAEKLRGAFPGVEIRVADDAAAATQGASIITLDHPRARARYQLVHGRAGRACERRRRHHQRAQGIRAGSVFPAPAWSRSTRSRQRVRSARSSSIGMTAVRRRLDGRAAHRRHCRGRPATPAETDISLFKPMGMGISDVALGIEIIRRAQASGDRPRRCRPPASPPPAFPSFARGDCSMTQAIIRDISGAASCALARSVGARHKPASAVWPTHKPAAPVHSLFVAPAQDWPAWSKQSPAGCRPAACG